jgi:hypothetical protein
MVVSNQLLSGLQFFSLDPPNPRSPLQALRLAVWILFENCEGVFYFRCAFACCIPGSCSRKVAEMYTTNRADVWVGVVHPFLKTAMLGVSIPRGSSCDVMGAGSEDRNDCRCKKAAEQCDEDGEHLL